MRNLPTGRMRKTKKRLAREGCAEYDWEPEDEDVAIVVIIVIAVLRLWHIIALPVVTQTLRQLHQV